VRPLAMHLVTPTFVAWILVPVAAVVPVGAVSCGEAEAAAGMTLNTARATNAAQTPLGFFFI